MGFFGCMSTTRGESSSRQPNWTWGRWATALNVVWSTLPLYLCGNQHWDLTQVFLCISGTGIGSWPAGKTRKSNWVCRAGTCFQNYLDLDLRATCVASLCLVWEKHSVKSRQAALSYYFIHIPVSSSQGAGAVLGTQNEWICARVEGMTRWWDSWLISPQKSYEF